VPGTPPVVPPAVVFDANGTLFDLAKVRDALTSLGAPEAALEAWFQRLLHEAATATFVDAYRPFQELARSSLRTTLAQLGLDRDETRPLDALKELDPYPEAAEALDLVRGRAFVLTNSGAGSTEQLLERAGLAGRIERVLSCDEVRRFKPHAAPYELARRVAGDDAVLVAAHGWDVVGARAAGMNAVWVDRNERVWPFPGPEPRRAADLAEAVRLALR
jgi:2-haloacid dehalogenase